MRPFSNQKLKLGAVLTYALDSIKSRLTNKLKVGTPGGIRTRNLMLGMQLL